MIAELIKFLISQTEGSAHFHVVGFSLGAQTAGYVGSRLREAGLTLGRITGSTPVGRGRGGSGGWEKGALYKSD